MGPPLKRADLQTPRGSGSACAGGALSHAPRAVAAAPHAVAVGGGQRLDGCIAERPPLQSQ